MGGFASFEMMYCSMEVCHPRSIGINRIPFLLVPNLSFSIRQPMDGVEAFQWFCHFHAFPTAFNQERTDTVWLPNLIPLEKNKHSKGERRMVHPEFPSFFQPRRIRRHPHGRRALLANCNHLPEH